MAVATIALTIGAPVPCLFKMAGAAGYWRNSLSDSEAVNVDEERAARLTLLDRNWDGNRPLGSYDRSTRAGCGITRDCASRLVRHGDVVRTRFGRLDVGFVVHVY